jgi:hypothetical protein
VFVGCEQLKTITIPSSVTTIYTLGDAISDIYYKGTQAQWDALRDNNPFLRDWVNKHEFTLHVEEEEPQGTTNEAFSGTVEEPEADMAWQATFAQLAPNTEYVVLVSVSAENPLESGNLQYITQLTAAADGTLTVCYYQKAAEKASYVVACGNGKTSAAGGGGSGNGSGNGSGGGSDGSGAVLLLAAGVGVVAAVAVARVFLPVPVSGTVTDPAGKALANVTITMLQGDKTIQQAVTDANGRYTVKAPRGEYTLTASYVDPATGQTVTQKAVVKAPNKAFDLALTLPQNVAA